MKGCFCLLPSVDVFQHLCVHLQVYMCLSTYLQMCMPVGRRVVVGSHVDIGMSACEQMP